MDGAITYERVVAVNDELAAAFERLIPQLSPGTPIPTKSDLAEIVACPTTQLWIARDAERNIVGTLTLAFYRTPTGLHAWIEDVVVDEAARGRGIGAELTEIALQQAAQTPARYLCLTSRPARLAANHLYQSMGFERWETNAYRYDLKARRPIL